MVTVRLLVLGVVRQRHRNVARKTASTIERPVSGPGRIRPQHRAVAAMVTLAVAVAESSVTPRDDPGIGIVFTRLKLA